MSTKNSGSQNTSIPEEDTDGQLSSTDTEGSSSSSHANILDNQALVLELHELRKEGLADNPPPEVKTRRLSKKRAKRNTEQSVASLSSSSERLVLSTVQGEPTTEEYFDAQENGSAFGSVSDLSIPGPQKDKSKTIERPPSSAPTSKQHPTNAILRLTERESSIAQSSPVITDTLQDNRELQKGGTGAQADAPTSPTTNTITSEQANSTNSAQEQTEPVAVDRSVQPDHSKPESAETGSQPDIPTTTSQQTVNSKPVQQQTSPLSKPTEPRKSE